MARSMEDCRSFNDLFRKATKHDPYPYQIRMSECDALPDLIEAPTGMGKTECAILAWIWRRRYADESIRRTTSRRLIYCLPMRTLVEQTQRRVSLWLDRLGLEETSDTGGTGIRLVKMLGGEIWNGWDTRPEEDQIIIGTQDMLLSRALNRGYAMSRFRWPLHFGLFSNDCTWVIDEPQLMGVGFQTTAQIRWFRQMYGGFGPTHTIWMSATIRPDWLKTIDFPDGTEFLKLSLDASDESSPSVQKRLHAKKHLSFAEAAMGDMKGLASEILADQDGSLTLVVVNTVVRAKELFKVLSAKKGTKVVLLHSQFRPSDRDRIMEEVSALGGNVAEEGKGAIIVSTQVVEAGVDISAKRLFTELAPWSSLVQRFGRCNRRGECDLGEIKIIRPNDAELEKRSLPYDSESMEKALALANGVVGVFDSSSLPKEYDDPAGLDIIRSTDLIELFDTTSDIFGSATDVSRFIRADDDSNVHVFWRDPREEEQPLPKDIELCPVPISELRDLVKAGKGMFRRFDHISGEWVPVRMDDIIPGATIMMDPAEGRYSVNIGWDKEVKDKVPIIVDPRPGPGGYGEDRNDVYRPQKKKTILEHSNDVVRVAENILNGLPHLGSLRDSLLDAALWHDSGKAHPSFQVLMGDGDGQFLAKSEGWLEKDKYEELVEQGIARRYFRHELASALMCIGLEKDFLISYIVAAHHGKVRVSIRALPGEKGPTNGSRFARGVWDGDMVPIPLKCPGANDGEIKMDLSLMDLGGANGRPSWADQVLALRDSKDMGPFRMAYLEGLLRSADERASGGE